jgi:hypothetical protein
MPADRFFDGTVFDPAANEAGSLQPQSQTGAPA